MTRLSVFTVAAGTAVAAASPASAQSVTTEDLQAALRQRDAVIAALEKRVAALEAERTAAKTATAPAPVASSAKPPVTAQSDDLVALQALSRGLVERGLLLLPKGSIELSPSIGYSHTQTQGLVLVETPEGISTVSDQRLRNDALEWALTGRIGLPWRSQLQFRVPYDWKRTSSALGDGTEVTHSATHVGDVELELSHQFLVEKGARPDLIAAVSWRFPTGSDPYRTPVTTIASGNGTHQVTARLTLLKTIDPLVVFTNISYSANLDRHEFFGSVHPGDFVDWQLGTLLAVSPQTSLSFGFDQQFKFRAHVSNKAIAGSDGVGAVAQFGVDQVLSARTLLDLSVGVGVTRDAPDYRFMASLPIRFR
jgi:hypothetical protein